MDWWIEKQLRAQVLQDLAQFLPADFFEVSLHIDQRIPGTRHHAAELNWGHKAGDLGRKLFFQPNQLMTPRQVAASGLLLNLGLLAGASAAQGLCDVLAEKAASVGVADGNASKVSEKLSTEQIPQLKDNVQFALSHYLHHLNESEATPYLRLFPDICESTATLSSKEVEVLEALLETTGKRTGVDSSKFRAKHFVDIKIVDDLLRRGLIRQDNQDYWLGLVALPELKSKRAREIQRDAELIFAALRRQYLETQTAPIKLRTVASLSQLTLDRARTALTMMREASWWSGWGDFNVEDDPIVAPAESILGAQSFEDLVKQLSELRDRTREVGFIGPPAVHKEPHGAAWLECIPAGQMKDLLVQINEAAKHDLDALVAMGVRAVIDLHCTQQIGQDIGGFEKKLDALLEARHISTQERHLLSAVVDVGSAAVHRGHLPGPQTTNMLMTALKRLVEGQYGLAATAEKLRRATPKRDARQNGGLSKLRSLRAPSRP